MKKKKLISIILTFAMIFLFDASNVEAKETITYTALGDSLTDSATYEGKDWTSYPYYIVDDLKNEVNIVLNNHGIGGYQTSQVLDLIQSDQTVIKDIKNSDIITIQVGANNITYAMLYSLNDNGYIEMPWDFHFEENINIKKALINAAGVLTDVNNDYHIKYITSVKDDLNKTIKTIRKYNKNAEIYIATVYFDSYTFSKLFQAMLDIDANTAQLLTSGYSMAASEIQGYFKEAAKTNNNVYFVDNSKECNLKYFQYDENGQFADIHPNEKGQKVLAKCFEDAFYKNWNRKEDK